MASQPSDPQTPYDRILALLPQLTIDELACIELEIRRRIQQDAHGESARLRAAVNSLPSKWGESEQEK